MDKGNPKRANGEVTRGKEGDIPLDLLDQTIRWGRGEKREKKERKKREEEGGERSFTLSLDFLEIRSSAFIEARNKVDPHSEIYVWVLKSRSFDKLQGVGDFSYSVLFLALKAIK